MKECQSVDKIINDAAKAFHSAESPNVKSNDDGVAINKSDKQSIDPQPISCQGNVLPESSVATDQSRQGQGRGSKRKLDDLENRSTTTELDLGISSQRNQWRMTEEVKPRVKDAPIFTLEKNARNRIRNGRVAMEGRPSSRRHVSSPKYASFLRMFRKEEVDELREADHARAEMSKEGNSGEAKPQDASAPDVQADVPSKDTNAEIYENRRPKKIIRVVTVMAYLFSVSFVGILLSAYYIFLWEPPNPRLIERGRLQADPQMQFQIAIMPSEKTDLRKKGNDFFLETEVNRAYKPLLNRMPYGAYDRDDPNVNSQDTKQERLNAMLLKLRHTLVKTHAQNRNLSKHEAAISGESNNSFIRVEKMLNSSKITENLISSELRKNITEEETRSNNTDLPPEFTDPVNMLDIESTSKATTIHESKQKRFNGGSLTDANLIVDREKENRNYKSKHNVAKL
ncbi:general transcriptional corepressor trfa-like isoform x1 protein, partial [Lasius niger]